MEINGKSRGEPGMFQKQLQKQFQKQMIMRKVVYSLIPIFAFSILLYGWRSLAVAAVVFVCGILAEYSFTKPNKKKISEAVLVTCSLYALSLPPGVPLWSAAVGIVFGVVFAKNIYGGFGRNIFNPAIAGRVFVYVCFPEGLQRSFLQPWRWGTPWTFGFGTAVDAGTSATPLMNMMEGSTPGVMELLSGFRIGSMGESAILLIIGAGIYLIATKTANWKIMLGTLIGVTAVIGGLNIGGFVPAGRAAPVPLLQSLFSGSILYITVFMVTDPVSAPNKPGAQWTYGILIGGVTATIRIFSFFPEGVSFAILIGNTFASLLDEWFPAAKKKKKSQVQKKPVKPATAPPADPVQKAAS